MLFSQVPVRGLFFVLLTLPALASPGASSWTGTVRDAAGNPIAEGVLELRSSSGRNQYSVRSSAAGSFAFPAIAAGKYELSITSGGVSFKSANQVEIRDGVARTEGLQLSSPDKGLVLISIGVGGARTEQEIGAAPQASGGEHLSKDEVSGLPLNSRDFSKLLLLAAGTMTDANGAANFTQQFAVNGQRGSATVFAIDGADTTDPEMGGATFSNFNVDAIQEVQSNSGVLPAEIGHGGASFTNVVTRSGTKDLHGSVFEFLRNASLDARNYFDHVGLDHRRIPPFIRNEFGGTIGGAVTLPGVHNDRTFFFGEYQGFRQILGTTQVFPVPTADERLGVDTTTYPKTATSPGDTLSVPVAPAIQPVLDRYPLPNDPSGSFGVHTYSASSKVTTRTDQFSIRIDHRISDKAQLLTRFSLNQVNGPVTNPDQTAIDPSFAIQFYDHQRSAGVTYTRTIGSHLTSQTSLGYIRSTPFFPAANHTQPAIGFGDGLFQSFGAPAGSIFGSYSNLYQLKQDMTALRGNHNFKWGIEIRVNRDSTIFGTAPNGAYSFGGGTAYAPYDIPSASGLHDIKKGDPLPDSLTGLLTATPYSYNISALSDNTPGGAKFDEAGVRREAYNFYFQDNWKASSRLTLSYGLRYEVNSRIHEQTKRTSSPYFFDAAGKPTSYWNHNATQRYILNPQPPYNQDWNGWGPRLAVDYAFSTHTVLHAGGSITTIVPNLWQDNFLTASIPFVFNPFFTAEQGAPVPFQNTFVPEILPIAYDIHGQPAVPNGKSADALPNTEIDLARFQTDVAANTPGHQTQLPAVAGFAQNFQNGYIGSYTLGLDHDFRDVKATLAYVATTGIHLPCVFSPNSYSGADPAFAPFTIFDPTGKSRIGGYGNESVMTSSSHSSYHSLQASVSKNSPRAGVGLQASYTYSKSLDDTSSVLGGLFGTAGVILQTLPQDPWNPRAEKGPSTFDVTHVVTLSWIQLVPLNRVSFFRSLPKAVTKGWQFLNITTLTTGSPFTVYSGVQQTGAGAGGTDRPDLIKMPNFSTSRAVRADYFGLGKDNASFFSIPCQVEPQCSGVSVPGGTGPNQGRFGTLGRNTFRGPAFHDFDFALVKDTTFGRRANGELGTLEFRAEFFNAFNLANFGLPSNIVRGSGFGIISKTAGSSRQVQFSLKLIF